MKDLLLLDYETTGFSVGKGHEGIQLAAVRLDGATLVELASFSTNIRPENPHLASASALAVTGACLKSLALAPPSRLVLAMFEEALFSPGEKPAEACMAVAHNAGFDRRFHKLLLERAGCENNRHGEFLYCSMKYLKAVSSRWRMPLGRGGMSLDALVVDAGLPERGDHDALEDVRIVADVLRFTRRYIPSNEMAAANSIWASCYTDGPKKSVSRGY